MYEYLKEYAARGARRCDEFAAGWYRKIDTASLNIASPSRCICGQLGGGYGKGLQLLELSYASAASYGFASCGRGTMELLTQAWKEEIEARLLADEFAASESSAQAELVGV